MNSPLNTSNTAIYSQEFPSLLEVFQPSKSLPTILTPSKLISPSTPPRSSSSQITVPSPFPLPELRGYESDPIPTARNARHELVDSPESFRINKKPRLKWKLEQTFSIAQEQASLKFLESLAPPGFNLSKNQPYSTKEGVVQCYRCSARNRMNCHFAAKVVYTGIDTSTNLTATFICNCPPFLHRASCKHSLGMCILHKLVTIPPQWKCNSIAQLKKVMNCLQR
jgi:hypothetical protein